MARVGSRSRGAPQEPRPHPTPPPILYYNSPNGVTNTNVPTFHFLQCGNVVLGLVLGTSKLPRPTPMFPQYSFCSVGTWCWGWGWVPTPNTKVPTMHFLQCGNVVLGVGLASHAQRHCSHNAVSVVWSAVLGVGLGFHAQHQCSHNAVSAVWERGVWGGVGLPRPTPMFPQCSFCTVGARCWGGSDPRLGAAAAAIAAAAAAANANVPTMQFLLCGAWCWAWVWASTPNTNVTTMQFLLCGNVVFGVGVVFPRPTPMLPQWSFFRVGASLLLLQLLQCCCKCWVFVVFLKNTMFDKSAEISWLPSCCKCWVFAVFLKIRFFNTHTHTQTDFPRFPSGRTLAARGACPKSTAVLRDSFCGVGG